MMVIAWYCRLHVGHLWHPCHPLCFHFLLFFFFFFFSLSLPPSLCAKLIYIKHQRHPLCLLLLFRPLFDIATNASRHTFQVVPCTNPATSIPNTSSAQGNIFARRTLLACKRLQNIGPTQKLQSARGSNRCTSRRTTDATTISCLSSARPRRVRAISKLGLSCISGTTVPRHN
jgi:hypothetical protein